MAGTITFRNHTGAYLQVFQEELNSIPGARLELIFKSDLRPDDVIAVPLPDTKDNSKINFYFLPIAFPPGKFGHRSYDRAIGLPEKVQYFSYDPLKPSNDCSVMAAFEEPVTSASIRFENKSNLSLSLERLESSEVSQTDNVRHDSFKKLALIGPYEKYVTSGFLNEQYILRDVYSGMVIEWLWIDSIDYSYQLLRKGNINGVNGNEPVKIRFINCSSIAKEVRIKNCKDGSWEQNIPVIKAGETIENQYFAGQICCYPAQNASNVNIDDDTVQDQLFIASSDPVQNVFLIDKKSVQVSFQNRMNLVLNAYMTINGERHLLGAIAPHDTLSVYSEKGREWVFTAKFGAEESVPIHRTTILEAGTCNLSGNYLGEAVITESKTRKVRLINKSPFDVIVQEKKADESLGNILGAVESKRFIDLELKIGTALEIKDQYSGYRITQIVVPHGDDIFSCDIQLKSWNDQQAATLTVYNRTSIWLDVYWFDYEGVEKKIREIAPGCMQKLQTFLTHPLVVKDQKSGRIVEWFYANKTDELVEISSFSIVPKEGEPTVQIDFTNKLPFGVDLYQVTTEHKETHFLTLPPQGTYTMPNNQNASPIRIREFQSQAEVEMYVPSRASKQTLDIELKAADSTRKTTVEILNLSLFSIDVFAFNTSGVYSKLKGIDSRMSETLSDIPVGQPFFIRERNSQKVLGYFVSTVYPVRYEFSGINLRSVFSEQTNQVTFQNASNLPIDVYWMNYDGEEESKGHMEPKGSFITNAGIGHIYVFRETTSGVLLDEVILSSSSNYQKIDIMSHIISPTTRNTDQLWPGEVALFTEPNYQGKVYIFHNDVYSYLLEIENQIKSIKLGPGTALTAFTEINYLGDHDVFHLDTLDLSGSDVKYNMSSFQLSTMIPELTSGISAISRLTEEPILNDSTGKKEISYHSVFRTTLTFPVTVSAVDIFSTEEATFKVGAKTYTVDPIKHARIHMKGTKQLVLTSPATQLRESILMVRTDTMHENERFFVFQDMDLHKKLASLEPGTFVKEKQRLGINSTYNDSQIQDVQTAIQNLAKTIPGVQNKKAIGQTKDLYIAADGMTYNAWGLNFTNGQTEGNDQAVFRPLSLKEIEEEITRANEKGIPRRNLDTEVGQGFFDDIKKAASGATSFIVQPIKVIKKSLGVVAGAIIDPTSKGVAAVAETFKNTAQVVSATSAAVIDTTQGIAAKGVATVIDTAKGIGSTGIEAVKGVAQEVAATGVAATNMVKSGVEEIGAFASDTTSAAMSLPSKAIDLTEDVFEDVVSVGETVLKATLTLGNEIIDWTIDTVDKIADCIEFIIKKVVDSVDKVIDYLKDLFNWQDIIDTQDLLVRYFNSSFDVVRTKVIPKMETEIDKFLSSIEDKVMGYLDEMIDDFGADVSTSEVDEKSVGDEAIDKLNWFIDKIFGDGAPSTTSSDSNSSLGSAEEQQTILAVLEELRLKLTDLVNQYGPEIIDTFIDGIETMVSAVTAGKDAGKRIIGGLLTIAKALLLTGFAIVKTLIAILIKLFKALITLFQQACNAIIQIPIISDLYKIATGSDLTILSVASLLIAAPMTIICKIAFKKSPKEMIAPTSSGISEGTAQFLSINYGLTHIVSSALETLNDLASAREEFDIPGLKSKKPQQLNVQNGANATGTGQAAVIQNVRRNIPGASSATPGGKGPSQALLSLDEPSYILPIVVLILGVFSQITGLPLKTEPQSATGANSSSGAVDRVFNYSFDNAKNSLALSVWIYQWFYLLPGLAAWGFDKFVPAGGVKNGLGTGLKIITTTMGIVHFGAQIWQIVLDSIATKEAIEGAAKKTTEDATKETTFSEREEIAKVVLRSSALLLTTIPYIGKALFIEKINLSCKSIPAVVGSGFNFIGHAGEGLIFIARACYKDV